MLESGVFYPESERQREVEVVAPPVQHIAFIVDGNRRWAKENGLTTMEGHVAGFNRMQDIIKATRERNIPYATFYAFSTENWNRHPDEVGNLMDIFREMFSQDRVDSMVEEGIHLNFLGDLSAFPKDIEERAYFAREQTNLGQAMTVNIALNYGGRSEIVRAVNSLLASGVKEVDEEAFSQHLYTSNQPDPDIIVRTGGAKRLSGYLPWQSTYSELMFVDDYWPDFDEEKLTGIFEEYAARERRFGK